MIRVVKVITAYYINKQGFYSLLFVADLAAFFLNAGMSLSCKWFAVLGMIL